MIRLRQLWQDIRSSFWFVPSLCVLTAVGLAVGLVAADGQLERELFDRWPRLFGSGAAGARGLLATVASSMITVVGVVFSITIVALSLASSQYTSRVLRNFMRDRSTQAVLGVFVGIFAYCLVVLRTIREGPEVAFVPSLAVLFGLILAFVGIGVLIYFIHHISTSIQAAHILAAAAEETRNAIDTLYPDEFEVGDDDEDLVRDDPARQGYTIDATETGYLQGIDRPRLLSFAHEREAVLWIERDVGQFVIAGTPIASMLSTGAMDSYPNEEERRNFRLLYTVGSQRTVEQDAGFGIRQIVDVALKALSPGINDTTTAVMCIDHLTAILVRLTGRRIPTRYSSEDGEVRLVTHGPTYESLIAGAFDQIRQNADGNIAVLENLLSSLELLAGQTQSPARRKVLARHVEAVADLCQRSIPEPRDLELLEQRSSRVLEGFEGLTDSEETR